MQSSHPLTSGPPCATTWSPCSPCASRYRHPGGHVLVRCPGHPYAGSNGYVAEHRLIVEQALGRYLLPGEKVRHRNRDRADNRVENLELVRPQTPEERFWGKVGKGPGCWEWRGRRHRQGYGVFWIGRKILLAHRFVYELQHGPLPSGQCVCHRCDNPPCVNPGHLFAGTQRDNMQDRSRKRRGHRLSEGDARAVRLLREVGVPVAEVAARFGVSRATVLREAPGWGLAGERNGHAKLTAEAVRAMRRRHGRGEKVARLAHDFGVSEASVYRIVTRRSWKSVPEEQTSWEEVIDAVFSSADIRAALSDDIEPLFPVTRG